MKLHYKQECVDIDKVLKDVGDIILTIEDWTGVSKFSHPEINKLNCFKISLQLSKGSKICKPKSVVVYECGSREEAETMKQSILDTCKEKCYGVILGVKKE